MTWPDIIGYGLSLIVGHVLVQINVDALWKGLGVPTKHRKRWHPAFLGFLERAMYTYSFVLSQPAFIALWLGLKAVPQWKRWNDETTIEDVNIEGRAVFNVFLIGNALSVLFAIVGAESIKWLTDKHVAKTVNVCLLLVVSSLIFFALSRWVFKHKKQV